MSADEILFDAEERMEKAIEVLKKSLSGIRTGRANPGLVDSLRVEVYGSPTPIKQVASVGAPEPTQIVIRPYDPSTIKSPGRTNKAKPTHTPTPTVFSLCFQSSTSICLVKASTGMPIVSWAHTPGWWMR